MSKLPGSVPCWKVINALQRDAWIVIRHHKMSHIQLAKRDDVGPTRITISDHGTVSRQVLARLLKQARIDVDRFLELL